MVSEVLIKAAAKARIMISAADIHFDLDDLLRIVREIEAVKSE